jgi:hypothetical protein
LEATVDKLRVSVGTLLDFNAKAVRCYALSEQSARGLLGFGSTPMRIYSSPSHLGRSAGFTSGQAHFYYAVVSADPDDPDDGHKFYMLCPGVWVLLKHGDEACAKGLSHDWSDCDFRPPAALARFVLEARHNDALRRSACWSDSVPPESAVPTTHLAAPGMHFEAPYVAMVQPAVTLPSLQAAYVAHCERFDSALEIMSSLADSEDLRQNAGDLIHARVIKSDILRILRLGHPAGPAPVILSELAAAVATQRRRLASAFAIVNSL